MIGSWDDPAIMSTKCSADQEPAGFPSIPEPVTIVVDEIDYRGSSGSSLPAIPAGSAKKDDAANKISFARLSSLTSRCSSLIFAASDVVVPGLAPESISALFAPCSEGVWVCSDAFSDSPYSSVA